MSLIMSRLGGFEKSYQSTDRDERFMSTEDMLFKLENDNLAPTFEKNINKNRLPS
jgi:hypothetical protein